MVIRGPVGTRSGYGDMSRDIVRHLINIDKWDIKVMPCPWGQTPMNALTEENPKDKPIIDRIIKSPPRKPEVFISITVPNEFQPMGQYNIGITAGIETTACSPEWVQGMNRMDLILTISNHSKMVLQTTSYQTKNNGVQGPQLKLEKPIEILHCCADTSIFRKISRTEIEPAVDEFMDKVKENFCFLFVGHWLTGGMGHDRKDIGMLIKVFLEVFRKGPKKNRPALILKTSSATFSLLDREEMLKKITAIKDSIGAQNFPSVYLLHGDLTEPEMNSLYNHPKVKVHVSFTKGEGFGRPLLEASLSGKPVVVSGWSGHMDFLNPEEAIILGGKLQKVDDSAAWEGVINAETQWFQVDYQNAANVLFHIWRHYKLFQNRGAALVKKNAEQFNFNTIQKRTEELMDKYLPEFKIPEEVLIDLPKLKKISVKKSKKKKKIQKFKESLIEKASLDAVEGAVGQTQQGAKASEAVAVAGAGEIGHTGEEIGGR